MKDCLDVYSDLGSVLQTRQTAVPAIIGDLDDYTPATWASLVRKTPTDPLRARVPAPPV